MENSSISIRKDSPQTHYQRLVFNGKDWTLYDSKEHKFWDSFIDDFPDSSRFINAGK